MLHGAAREEAHAPAVRSTRERERERERETERERPPSLGRGAILYIVI